MKAECADKNSKYQKSVINISRFCSSPLMCFLGDPEGRPATLNSDLFIRVSVDRDTVVVRLVSQQTTASLQDRAFPRHCCLTVTHFSLWYTENRSDDLPNTNYCSCPYERPSAAGSQYHT